MSSKPRGERADRAWRPAGVVVAALSLAAQWPALAADDAHCTSTGGRYRVSYTSQLEPLAINRMHSWVMHVETIDGDPVTGATIEVGGGMPEHDHGLATSPRATQELGDGDYLIEGLRFHMPGRWEIVVDLRVGADRDRCTLSLLL